MENNVNINEYVIVNTAGGRFIGKPHFGDSYLSDLIKAENSMKENVLAGMENGKALELVDALDFMTPMRPVPSPDGRGMALTRDLIVTSPDFTCVSPSIHVMPQAVYFCADLYEGDKDIIKQHVVQAMDAAQQQRAGRSGLTLATARG